MTATITDIALARDARLPHVFGLALCAACKYAWVATAPVGTYPLECPRCSKMLGVMISLERL